MRNELHWHLGSLHANEERRRCVSWIGHPWVYIWAITWMVEEDEEEDAIMTYQTPPLHSSDTNIFILSWVSTWKGIQKALTKDYLDILKPGRKVRHQRTVHDDYFEALEASAVLWDCFLLCRLSLGFFSFRIALRAFVSKGAKIKTIEALFPQMCIASWIDLLEFCLKTQKNKEHK